MKEKLTKEDIAEEIEAAKRFADIFNKNHGHLPLILHYECYEFFGNWCEVDRANIFDKVANCEVTLASRLGDVQTVEFSQVSWRTR